MRLSRKFSRLLLAGITTITLVAGTAGAAHADESYTTSGDFSWQSTSVKRLANCAASEWFNSGKSGGQIADCNNADSTSYWDGVHLAGADHLDMRGERVDYRSDQSCPAKHGFQYVKCYYVGGKSRGNIVMTVSIVSYGYGGLTARFSWYYL
ncbi:hypothetical protein ATY41_06125 [Leifsonia xyli subsp. xyli]|uniref:Secreted protein n=2 Tax=Leifsonia xyli subsp. xyli TaxID=59736 RepID=Q6ABZ5_LEIXX|nr:hypothetical protein [Leifsonia xyli]AAT90097.1 hypothetical protein Lxx24830 [Leifsonia xyli subsp. xyli str. CTCB07]ODA89295.1 hypothetical protein ATY41_06125 [Leifsonia xyli subsp. xyli]